MPRLGDDPNMATAYPERVNLRGSWMRQLLYTMVATFVMYKVVFTDYKRATKESMAKNGLSEEAQERLLPKTTAEKRREAAYAKASQKDQILKLTYEVGNLTNAVIELQKLAADQYGVTVQYPITLGEKEEGDEDVAQPEGDGAGGDESGNHPTLNLRGGGEDGGSRDGDGDVDGSGVAAGGGGDGARRLLTREKGEPEEEARGVAGGDGPAGLRGGSVEPRKLEGSERGDS